MSRLTRRTGGGRRRLQVSAAAALLLAAAGTLAVGLASQHHAPQPPASAALPPRAPTPTTPSSPPGTSGAGHGDQPQPAPSTSTIVPTPVAPPVAISIPAIGVNHALLHLGHNADGTLQVPPLSDVAAPGWDGDSPPPGQVGPAIIVGHVDGDGGGTEGVFFRLGALRPGDQVSVSRSDGTVALFRIDGVNEYPKESFPTLSVYGNTTTPQLRLITCGGQFDRSTGHYLDNIVAYATLTGTQPA